jgi:phosphate transport system permease protein
LILIFIIVDISIKGLPHVTAGFLLEEPHDMGRSGGIVSTIVSTAYITLLAILLASPLGVGTAIYLTEYTREGWATRIIRFGAECLAGVPSIILGLFGFVLFVMKMGLGWSVLSGGLTLAIMVLPIIIRTSEEAIKAVPQDYRTACYSLGMSQWQTITRIVLPSALPGITTGIMLSVGRSLGETAVLLFTAGAALRTPATLFDSGRTMAVHFYILAREGISMPNAYATAAILMISILLINLGAYTLMQRLMRRYS